MGEPAQLAKPTASAEQQLKELLNSVNQKIKNGELNQKSIAEVTDRLGKLKAASPELVEKIDSWLSDLQNASNLLKRNNPNAAGAVGEVFETIASEAKVELRSYLPSKSAPPGAAEDGLDKETPVPTSSMVAEKERKIADREKINQGEGIRYANEIMMAYSEYLRSPDRTFLLNFIRGKKEELGGQNIAVVEAANERIKGYFAEKGAQVNDADELYSRAENVFMAYEKIKLAARASNLQDFSEIVNGVRASEQEALKAMSPEEKARYMIVNGGLRTDARYKDLVPEICENVYADRNYLDGIENMLKDGKFLKAREEFEKNGNYDKAIVASVLNTKYFENLQKSLNDPTLSAKALEDLKRDGITERSIQTTDIPTQYAFFTATKAALEARGVWNPDTVNTISKMMGSIDENGRAAFFTYALPAIVAFFPKKEEIEQLMLTCGVTDDRIALRFQNNLSVKNDMVREYYKGINKALERVASNRGLVLLNEIKANPDTSPDASSLQDTMNRNERDFSIKTEAERIRDRVRFFNKNAPYDVINPYGYTKPPSIEDAPNLFFPQFMQFVPTVFAPGVDPTGNVNSLFAAIEEISDISELDKRFYHLRFGLVEAGTSDWWSSSETPQGKKSLDTYKVYGDMLGAASNMHLNADAVKEADQNSDNFRLTSVRSSGENLTISELLGTTTKSYSVDYVRDQDLIMSLEQMIATSQLTESSTKDYSTAEKAVNMIAYYRKSYVDNTYEKDLYVKYGRTWMKVNAFREKKEDSEKVADYVYGRVHYDPNVDMRAKWKDLHPEGFIVTGNLGKSAVGLIKDAADGKNDTAGFVSTEAFGTQFTLKGFEKRTSKTVTTTSDTWKPPVQDQRFLDMFKLAGQSTAEAGRSPNPANINDVNKLIFTGMEIDLLIVETDNGGLFPKWLNNGWITADQYTQLVGYVNENRSNPKGITLRDMWREYEKVVLGITTEPTGGEETQKTVAQSFRSIAIIARNPTTEAALSFSVSDKDQSNEKSGIVRKIIGNNYAEAAGYKTMTNFVDQKGGMEKLNDSGWSTFDKVNLRGSDVVGFIILSQIANEQGKSIGDVGSVKFGGYTIQATNYQAATAGSSKDNLKTGVLEIPKGVFDRTEIASGSTEQEGLEGKQVALNTRLRFRGAWAGAFGRRASVKTPQGESSETEAGAGVLFRSEAGNLALTLRGTVFGEDTSGGAFTVAGMKVTEKQWKWICLISGEKRNTTADLARLSNLSESGLLNQSKIEQIKYGLGLYTMIRKDGGFFLTVENTTQKNAGIELKNEVSLFNANAGATYIYISEKGSMWEFSGSFNYTATEETSAGLLTQDAHSAGLKFQLVKNRKWGVSAEYGNQFDFITKQGSGHYKVDMFYRFF